MEIPGYKILEPLGKGGMAQVYLALQESVGRKVAIKVMNASLTPDPQFIERFIAEARCANLNHPNIITVFDAGQAANQPFIVMEYIEGGDLAKRLRQGPFTPAQALAVIRQVAAALHASHQKGYVHRDVKPENVLFRDNTTVILADFGIAKALQGNGNMTQTGMIIGSPSYMSPEQIKGDELDGRSDLYSLGVMFYQLLTGAKPYHAEDTYALGYKHINEPIPALKGDLKLFQPLLNSMMAKLKNDRVPSGQELVRRIDVLASTLTPQQAGYPASAQKNYPFNLALASGNISFQAPEDETEKTLVGTSPGSTPLETKVAAKHVTENKTNWLIPALAGLVLLIIVAGVAGYWTSHKNVTPESVETKRDIKIEPPPPLKPIEQANTPNEEAANIAEPEKTKTIEPSVIPAIKSTEATTESVTPETAVQPPVVNTKKILEETRPLQTETPLEQKPETAKSVEEKPAAEKPSVKENKPSPNPKQIALADALKKGKICLQNKNYSCATLEASKALNIDANNSAAKTVLQQAKDGEAAAKKSFLIE